MSIDEAIKLLTRLINKSTDGYEVQALNMAIMALEYMHEDWAEYEEYCKRKESEKNGKIR